MRGRFTENSSAKSNMGSRAMTRRKKWMALAGIAAVLLVLLLILRPWENHRSTPSEEPTAPPHREGPAPSAAKKDAGQTTVPKVDQGEQPPVPSELQEVSLGSISGRLVDIEGEIIGELETTLQFFLVGEGMKKIFDIHPDGSYCLEGLPEGVYWIKLYNTWELRAKGRLYCLEKFPERVPTGTVDASVVVVCPNPGAIRGKVLYARTMQPITEFAVYQKYDHKSAPDRSRRSSLYSHLKLASGYPRQGYRPLVDTYKQRCDRLEKRLESLDPETDEDEVQQVMRQYNTLTEKLERYRLDIISEEGVFDRSGYLLGDYVFTVLAEGCLPESVEVAFSDSTPVEITFLMDGEGSTVVGKVEDDSGRPVRDATVEILIPTNTEYLYFWTADPKWERLSRVTEESGEFAFENLADGSYEIRASHADYGTTAITCVTILDGGQTPPSVILRMRGGDASVWGQISAGDGSPQTGTALRISCGFSSVECVTDGGGYYSAAGLPPGDYIMTIEKEGLGGREWRFSLSASQQVRYDVSLAGSSTLQGAIYIKQHLRFLGQSLRMVLRSDGLTIRSQSHDLGGQWYQFKSLPPGRYELEVLWDMLGNVKHVVTLASNETKWVDLNLGQYGTLKGRVIGRDGGSLPGVALTIVSPTGEASTASDPEGRYVVRNLSPGHIQLTIPEGKFAGTWYEFELKKFTIGDDPVDTEWDIDFSPLGDVSGQILQADGKPLGLAALRVESPHRSMEVITDREGRFRAEGLFPGQSRVHLPGPVRGRAYPFELAPQEDKDIEIVLPP